MKSKYLMFLLTTITICLIYIAFMRPSPQRYILKTTHKEPKPEPPFSQSIYDVSIFDTATGKEYMFSSITNFGLDNSTEKTTYTYVIRDLINGKVIHKDPEKTIGVKGYEEKK